MSETQVIKGKIKLIFVGSGSEMESYCKRLCLKNDIKTLDGFDNLCTWKEELIHSLSEKYLVMRDSVYEIIEYMDLKEESFCEINNANDDGEREFIVSFYDGSTCLSELLEVALEYEK